MKQPLVSILIVTYNAERFISAAVKSCLAQTYANTEILIFDNASADRTGERITLMNDPRIRLIRSDRNIGPYAGLNQLLEHAQGQYIAIQDHDDLWLPEKLDRQIAFLEHQAGFIACGTGTYYFFENRDMCILVPKPLETNFVDHTSLVFRRGNVRYAPSRPLPDEYFEMMTLRRLGKIACLPEGLTVHRIRGDKKNLSTSRTKSNVRGAWEHFRLTGGKDVSGLFLFLIAGWLPEKATWFIRRYWTFRNAQWIAAPDFEQQHHIQLH